VPEERDLQAGTLRATVPSGCLYHPGSS
jgi:hypothetical protein